MSIYTALNHKTLYRYDRKVTLGPQLIRLRPAPHARTAVEAYSLRVEPEPHFLNWLQDPQGNWLARVVFPDKVDHFTVEVDLLARMEVFNPLDFFVEDYAENYPFEYRSGLVEELKPFLQVAKAEPLFKVFLDDLPTKIPGYASASDEAVGVIEFLSGLNQHIQSSIEYLIRMEPGVQTAEETLRLGKGSCRDSAWLMVQTLRHLGLAARFVSGYLIQLKADQEALDGPSGTDHDFCDLHAWAEVYIPGAGWIGLDATSGLFAGEGHIPLVATPEPSSAAPISGGLDPCEVDFDHQMTVTRLRETPRVTLPYTEQQWQAVDALGERVDEHLTTANVQLTMGGEPTFVSIDDPEHPQWNTEALGEEKSQKSLALIKRLQQRWAKQGLISYEQGKWYPGEPLPRWAYCLYWRSDGKPLLRNPARFCLAPPEDTANPPDLSGARTLLEGLVEQLSLDPRHIRTGYEDPWHHLENERRLPDNLTLDDPRLQSETGRASLAKVLEKGLDKPVGCLIPIRRVADRWCSEDWQFRSERLYLLPGDSPMGLRLPLASLPWLPDADAHQVIERDPTEPRGPLPDPEDFVRRIESYMSVASDKVAQNDGGSRDASAFVGVHSRTALCVEARDGLITVFMPPLEAVEDYIELLTAVERTAEQADLTLRIEGYPPPRDARLTQMRITPDPGVVEVNIQPAEDWQQLKQITTSLYEEARLARLGTEKFVVDGRHVGTGGGNHLVVGGMTPEESPFLRRPDVLGSLIRYWQNHPSLSYFFAGMFIGPTSQAPRIDEARDSSLYELEIALQQLPTPDETVSPWVVDRVLRHILTDVTGNTHRVELCIDKLYSPDSATGRLGLVEFRGFEMPPHAQMSLVQQLLLRALIAQFWQSPCKLPLQAWGTRLHDEYMLPHYLLADLHAVLDDLNNFGLHFDKAWFDPHYEFRFPRFGQVSARGMTLELRYALEPWLVLGEEASGGGTSRYVDSSVERLQIRIEGLVDNRYVLTCNGRRLPLRATGVPGEFVVGVRFRAWKPWSCLHPGIEAHGPLVFDIVDTWSERAIAGCTYHVAHPAGRNYDSPPINANAAESRRLERFQAFGHTPGKVDVPGVEINPSYPTTLDLRYQA